MKWFQHQSDASEDIKIKRLEYKFTTEGYAIYFKLLEKVAKEGQNHRLNLKKFPLGFLASGMNVPETRLNEVLTEMNTLGLIVLKSTEICVPKMKKYTDNWSKRPTKKLQIDYRDATEKLQKEKKRIEKNRKEESDLIFQLKDWNKGQSSPLMDFKPENIINKYGAEKIARLVKMYGPKNNGFTQFLGALKTI